MSKLFFSPAWGGRADVCDRPVIVMLSSLSSLVSALLEFASGLLLRVIDLALTTLEPA